MKVNRVEPVADSVRAQPLETLAWLRDQCR